MTRSSSVPLGRLNAAAALVAALALALSGCLGGGGAGKDFSGPGHGSVQVTIPQGASLTEMGDVLTHDGVVGSTQAFVDAANTNPKATGIQPGVYRLKQQMAAKDAVAYLVDHDHLVQDTVTVPEGTRAADIVSTIVKDTKFSRSAVERVLADPKVLGLPAYAHGDPEGYLFPATYTVKPGDTPTTLLRSMVDKWREEMNQLGLVKQAKRVNLDPEQAITVASILEFEARRPQDYPKVARAIYNRLKAGMPLQSDATVSYASASEHEIWTSAAQRSSNSPYNTYKHKGLPPGPIGNPGLETIKAALHPAQGPWLYWVVVNLRTGETKFATTYAQHQQQVAEFHKYCQTSDAC